MNVNVNLMEQNVIQINSEITTNVTVKNIIYVKTITFGVLIHVVVKMESI